MPRRKQSSAVSPNEQFDKDADLLRVVEWYGDVYAAGLNALNYGQGVEAFQRATDALGEGDQDATDRLFAKWLEPFIKQEQAEELRARARRLRQGKPKRMQDRFGAAVEDQFGDPVRVNPEDLLHAVEVIHKTDVKRYPPNGSRTFNDICAAVAPKFGYKPSAKSVKKAAAAIKWPDPRRASK
ncbi:MAG: hypothetical protein ACXU9Z_07675 [Gemmatimonadaceae bacterium]